MATRVFINLPVRDLHQSMSFFRALGFTFNMQFTDHRAACMIIGENIYAMLLTEPFFGSFTRKRICDAHHQTEVLIALDAACREDVDRMIQNAIRAGGTTYAEPQDDGWMYGHSFADLDGHQWEILYLDKAYLHTD